MTGRTWVVWRWTGAPDARLAAALRARQAAGDTVVERPYADRPTPGRVARGRVAGTVVGALRVVARAGRAARGGATRRTAPSDWGRAGARPGAGRAVPPDGTGVTVHLATGGAERHRDRITRRVGQEVLEPRAALEVLTQAQRWDDVDRALRLMAARGEREPVRPTELVAAVTALLGADGGGTADPGLGADPMPLRLARLRTVSRRLVRQNRHAQAGDLLDPVLSAWDPDPALGLHALAAHAATSLTGTAAPDLATAAGSALAGADAALAAGDRDLAAELVTIGAGLLLHRDLHADADHSPLVDDTEAFLAPLRTSAAMAELAGPPRGVVPTPPSAPTLTSPGLRQVVVLPGAYQRFAGPLVAALEQRPDVRVQVVDLAADHRAFRWLGTDPALVRLRLAAAGEPPPTDPSWGFGVTPEQLAAVQRADVVVADWADKGAVWASLVVPPTTRLVVRSHGMDTFSLWPHLVDWSRVDALVSVSPHQADVLADVLRYGPAGTRPAVPQPVVVPNIVSLPPVPDPPPRDPHALVLVGWAKRVKDPLWAVEVLAGLLDRERTTSPAPGRSTWRLVLVGDGFVPGGVLTSQQYAASFAERVAAPDVAGHVHHVPQTDDVAREVAGVGFVLSSSVRESFHQGLVEGVLGGAVPVVRDWPYFARRDGARRLYPPGWVVDDVAAAVDRIWALREEADRAEAARAARAEVAERFDAARTGELLARVLLGD